jgi:hypothetical protein
VKRGGRPLRFLGVVALGWVGARAALLWPQIDSLPDAIRAIAPFARVPVAEAAASSPVARTARGRVVLPPARPSGVAPVARRVSDPMRVELALLNLLEFGSPEYVDAPASAPEPAPVSPALPFAQRRSGPVAGRWSASAWIVARPGTGIGAAPDGSQLGGGQAGVRIAWLLDPGQRIALYGRFAAPLQGKGREAALGVEWQPTRLPVRLIAEQRIGIDGQRGGAVAGLVMGLDQRLPAGFALESYGQAGAVVRGRVDPYADGAARATREVARQGPLRFSLGIGAWGAAQRDAARFDLGPSAIATLPVGRAQIRASLDWRQRIAGDARPGSGLALTLGGDF